MSILGDKRLVPKKVQKQYICIGYITRERSLRDLHTRGRGNVNHRRDRRDRLLSDATYLYHGKSIEHLARFEDRNSVWPKLMVSYKFLLKKRSLSLVT